LATATININLLRSYANILSNSTFEKVVRKKDHKYIDYKLKKYDKSLINKRPLTYKEYFHHVHHTLKNHYRNEYYYKNLIIEKILLGEYNLKSTTAINEFRINKSIADLVLINGSSKVFEIKTELDKPDRILNQINDYKKIFKEIFIVTHYSLKEKYLNIVDNSIGLIILTADSKLKTIREPKKNKVFDHTCIMKSLRKSEYTSIIKSYYGYLPDCTDFRYFKTCMNLFMQIPSERIHDLVIYELKKRTVKEKEILSSKIVPGELKHICLCLDFNKPEYSYFEKFLNKKIKIN
jgi:hypothetical protein